MSFRFRGYARKDRRIAILVVFKPKYEAAVGHLRRESQKTAKDIFLNKEHIPYLNDIGIYLKELVNLSPVNSNRKENLTITTIIGFASIREWFILHQHGLKSFPIRAKC